MNPPNKHAKYITVKDMALVGMAVAVIEVCKFAMVFLPNIELTTFWLILFTLFFGWKILFVVPVFILIEGYVFGFNIWWLSYLCAWPFPVILAWAFRKRDSAWFWSILSGAFGLCFGLLCAIPYVVVGTVSGNLQSGLYAGFTWWVAGIQWDIVHCIGNFVLMFVLYKPIRAVMKKFL